MALALFVLTGGFVGFLAARVRPKLTAKQASLMALLVAAALFLALMAIQPETGHEIGGLVAAVVTFALATRGSEKSAGH